MVIYKLITEEGEWYEPYPGDADWREWTEFNYIVYFDANGNVVTSEDAVWAIVRHTSDYKFHQNRIWYGLYKLGEECCLTAVVEDDGLTIDRTYLELLLVQDKPIIIQDFLQPGWIPDWTFERWANRLDP